MFITLTKSEHFISKIGIKLRFLSISNPECIINIHEHFALVSSSAP